MPARSGNKGFTLVEMIIAIAILAIIAAMNSQLLQQMIKGTRQQERVLATQFESALGLEMLRNDLSAAGFGLAENYLAGCGSCVEGTSSPHNTYDFATGSPPTAIWLGDNTSFTGYIPDSDYLVIRSTAVALHSVAGKWTYISGARPMVLGDTTLDMQSTPTQNYMIVVQPKTKTNPSVNLVMAGDNNFAVAYQTAVDLPEAYQPIAPERYIAFGVDDDTVPLRPYNRADYFIQRTATTSPSCAPNTGTLMKGVLNADSDDVWPMALVDCVANMQVLFRIDTTGDDVADQTVANLSTLGDGTAFSQTTRAAVMHQVKEVRVYLLMHEGTYDKGFNYDGSQNIFLGESPLGTTIDLGALVGSNWKHYRWKVYTLSVKPRAFYY